MKDKNEADFSGRPARTGKAASSTRAGDSGKTVYLLDPMAVRDLASALGLKPFQVVADLIQMKQFKKPDEEVDFETASAIATKYGFRPERPPPGMLIL